MKKIFLLNIWIVFLTIYVLGEAGPDSAKSRLLVSFERQTVRESDSFLIEVLLSNGESDNLTDAVLRITSPDFLSWYEVKPGNVAGDILSENRLEIYDVPATSLVRKKICVKSKPVIQVGSFNILFTVEFKLAGKTGFVSNEKPLQVSLFGSDTIAGVPLALAGFIVPGLFFWVITSWLRIPWSVGVALGDKMIYSVLVSLVFILIGTWIKWIDIDFGKGIGVIKLLRLAGGGAALGLIVGLPISAYLYIQQRRKLDRQLNYNDEEEAVFKKLLLRYPKVQRQFRIVLNDQNNSEYAGSLFEQTPTTPSESGFIWVIGWCRIISKIELPAENLSWLRRMLKNIRSVVRRELTKDEIWQRMQELYRNRELAELYDLAKSKGFQMNWQGISEKKPDGTLVYTDFKARRWQNSELKGSPTSEPSNDDPLSLANI